MRRILLFILPILIIVALVFTVFGIVQVNFEEGKLMDDLQRKAKTVAESTELSVKYVLINNDLRSTNRLTESFQKRERLQGCVIYDKDGKVLSITSRISDWGQKDKPYIKEALETKNPRGALEKFKEYSVYSYVLPVLDDEKNVLGVVEVVYDTSYVFTTLTELWRHVSTALIILVVSITLIMVLLQRRIFILPVLQLTEWFHLFQKGEIDKQHPITKEKGAFGKLASEVEQIALSLRIARKTISGEAQVRLENEDLWTEAKLRNVVLAKLGENALCVVSNREPYMHVIEDTSGETRCIRPASGVVTAVDPILQACGGTWIAHGSGNADRKFVNSKNKLAVPPEDNRYILKRVWLTKEEEQGYYYGFSNEGLWPLCHITHTRPLFRESDWQMYKEVNQKFADAVLEELPAKNPLVFIQDYHFTLLPKMIKEKQPNATVALFWHIPWPNPEIFATCPYQKEILDGMLACDLIGFHVQYHCNNFLDTANRLLESRVDTEKFSIVRAGKETFVRAFPISVDTYMGETTKQDLAEIDELSKEFELEGKIVAVGVERIDYTKGLIERMSAIDRFLEKYPQYKGKFVFLQLAAPSRIHIKRYHDLMAEIDEAVEKVNWKHYDGNWKPIIYLKRHFSPEEIKPYYALADVCIVSSLHDGMNLVAKEYVISNKNLDGVLVLSRFTGAARELTDAVQINPYSIEEFADAIKFAVEMPAEERKKRMENMRKIVTENNVYRWAGNIITELTALKKS
ncbi:MAG: trehalose-6-phosphate synthase [Candidatus Omnitrophica bacterium]|nr:trehalose-6-phosphate synthase [Candidatus Omnitrophota bacterium]MDD5546999.1 trehalose-6-phosphate synthase [Candidatus Omnitrophota bacterium]